MFYKESNRSFCQGLFPLTNICLFGSSTVLSGQIHVVVRRGSVVFMYLL